MLCPDCPTRQTMEKSTKMQAKIVGTVEYEVPGEVFFKCPRCGVEVGVVD